MAVCARAGTPVLSSPKTSFSGPDRQRGLKSCLCASLPAVASNDALCIDTRRGIGKSGPNAIVPLSLERDNCVKNIFPDPVGPA
jgi:hypothetical protein